MRFVEAIHTVDRMGISGLIECSPRPILLGMAQRTLPHAEEGLWLPTLRRGDTDPQTFLESVGQWWERGGQARFEVLHPRRSGATAYPMQTRRFWPDGDRFQRPEYTYRCTWVTAEPAPLGEPSWEVLGEPNLATPAVPASPTGILDARPVQGGDLRQWISAATETVRDAVERQLRVWWMLPETGADSVAMQAWCRAVFAEHPELRGGWIAGGDPTLLNLFGGHSELRILPSGPAVPRLVGWTPQSTPEIRGRWVLVGGLGALGRRTAVWLAEQGATELVITTRRDDPEWPHELLNLRDSGIDVRIQTVDPTHSESLHSALQPGATGVVLLAGATSPQRVLEATPPATEAVLCAKIDSVRALDQWSRNHSVKHFVVFGSIAGSWGSAELAAYGAANAYLAGVCQQRREDGLPGTCIAWGPWGGGGMVDSQRADRLQRMGQHLLEPTDALRIVGQALSSNESEIIAARVDWDRFLTLTESTRSWRRFDTYRRTTATIEAPTEETGATAWTTESLEHQITQRARQVMRLQPADVIEREQPLMERGFDSLMATELRNVLLQDGIDLPMGRLLGGPSIEEMTVMAEARMDVPDPAPRKGKSGEPQPEDPGLLLWTHTATFVVGLGVASAGWWAWFNLH